MKLSTNLIRSALLLILFCAGSLGVSAQTCPAGLVGYWKMDETAGTNLNEEVNGHDATRNSTTGPVSGIIGNSQRFSYTCNESETAYTTWEYATVPVSSALNPPTNASFTISYWCRFGLEETDMQLGYQDHVMISKGDWAWGNYGGVILSGCNGSGHISFVIRDNAGHGYDPETPGSYDDAEWHHVALVYDYANHAMWMYIDKEKQIGNGERTGVVFSGSFGDTQPWHFGSLDLNGVRNFFYKGDLDEVAFFNRALSSSEIEAIYDNGLVGVGICSVANVAPSIISTQVTNAVVGEAYSYDVNATGTPSSITYSLTTAPSGMAINSSTGLITWTPSSVGSFNVAVKASNGVNPDATQSFTITVTGSNPAFISTPVTTAGLGELYQYTAHASGTQLGMTYSLITKPDGMTINSTTGLISWTPNTAGDFDVLVHASNGIDPAADQPFTITVSGVPPTITTSPVTSAFVNVTYYYHAQASGTSIGMTYSLTQKPAGMTINSATGLITWVPSALGDFDVEVVADNGINPSYSQPYTISVVEPTNCPDGIISLHRLDEAAGPGYADFYDEHNATATNSPTSTTGIIDQAQLFGANTGIDIPDNGTEFDWLPSGSFSFEGWIKTSNTSAMVMVARNRTDYTGAARWYVGTDASGHATFELRDNGGPNRVLSGTSVITDGVWHHIVAVRDGDADQNVIYVDGVKENYASYSYVHSFKADNPLAVTIGYMKGAADEMHFIGTIDEIATYDRALGESEVATFYNDGIPSGHCRGTDNAPYFTTDPSTSINEDSPYTYNATVSDPDAGDVLSISTVAKPAWLSFSYVAGSKNCSLSGTPTNSNVGENDVILRVTDGTMSRDQIFRIVVVNVNDAPVITSTHATTVNEGSPYSYTLTVTDVDAGDVITMTKMTLPAWLTFAWTAGSKTATITGTPDDANVGSNSIDIRISDGTTTIHENYTLTVNNVNDVPVITGQSTKSVNEDNSFTVLKDDLTISDPDNPSSDITISVSAGTNYTFSGNTVTPATNFNGQLNVNVVAHDLAANSQTYQMAVTVNPVNDAPVITGQSSVEVNKNGSINILKSYLTISDVDNNASDISITVQSGSNYTFSGNVVTPANNYTGQLTVNVVANDLSSSGSSYGMIVSVVSSGNEPPSITGQSALSVNEDESITILKEDLTITDPDNPSSDITIAVQDGSNYTHTGNIVTPSANFNGQLTVNVIASDLDNNSAVHGVTVTVVAVNDQPVVTNQPSLSVTAGTLYAYIFAATDVESQSLTKTAILIPGWLSFDPGTGILSGVPQNSDAGANLVTLRVSDGSASVDLSFTITVSPSTPVDEVSDVVTGLYPSPASDVVNIRFNNLSEETMIEIISTTGSVVYTGKVAAHTDVTTINVQGINPGMYLCHIRNNKMNEIQRFMIAR
ncbi:MAG TPA: putative Ig domain-containing protein [Bacteroidales bacterium]|nr:putative Ig domain-containing protein [Bacteroidales bacterium]